MPLDSDNTFAVLVSYLGDEATRHFYIYALGRIPPPIFFLCVEMQAELVRRQVFEEVRHRFKLDVTVVIFAHADLRAVRDPVIPDSLPTTKRPELRVEMEAALREGIDRVLAAPPDPPGAAVLETRRGAYTDLTPFGVAAASVQSIRTRVLERALARTTGVTRAEAVKLVWRALTRYRYLGLISTMSAATPPEAYLKLARFGAVEGFASLFNCALPEYYGMFPDLEAAFGCRGNFFGLTTATLPAMLVCNPPYMPFVMNAFVNKCLDLLDRGQTTLVCILPAFETSDRAALNAGGRCREKYPVDYVTDVDTTLLKKSRHCKHCALYCKESFPFVESEKDVRTAMTSVQLLVLSSDRRATAPQLAAVLQAFPERDLPCSDGARAAALYVEPVAKEKGVRSYKSKRSLGPRARSPARRPSAPSSKSRGAPISP